LAFETIFFSSFKTGIFEFKKAIFTSALQPGEKKASKKTGFSR